MSPSIFWTCAGVSRASGTDPIDGTGRAPGVRPDSRAMIAG
jgi:hypothetical protein